MAATPSVDAMHERMMQRSGAARPSAYSPANLWRSHQVGITRLVATVVLFGAWEAVVRSRSVNPLFLSSPSQVVDKLVQVFVSGSIWPHLLVSGQEAVLGFGLAMTVGVPLGVAMGRVALVRHALEPIMMAVYSSPIVAFLPLLILWLGIGLWSKVALIFLGAVFVLIVNTETGVSTVDRALVETARSFTATNWQVLIKVVIPAAIPLILAGLRLAIGRVLIMMVIAEFYASTAGIGHLIFEAGAMYNTTQAFAGVTLLAITGTACTQALRALERRVAPWQQSQEEGEGGADRIK